MNTHVVTKQLPVGDRVYEPGSEVDASKWRHARLLVEQRYLKPLDGVVAPSGTMSFSGDDEFCSVVADKVIRKLRESGELAQLVQPNGRIQRMGRKDNHHGDQPRD